MTRPLLTEARDVLALPSFPLALQGKSTEGLLWDPGQNRVVIDSLPAVRTPPRHDEVRLDADALASATQGHRNQSRAIEPTAIFGGYLLQHFGHFLHESLSRLWWLGQGKAANSLVDSVRSRLQAEAGEVVFFMPRWQAGGRELPPYMTEVLTALGLPTGRIRILVEPIHLRHLLIPAQCWGLSFDELAWNKHLGCDCRELMRTLLGSFPVPPTPMDDGLPPSGKLYVTRSGLPPKKGRLLGDVFLDPLLEASGFRIFHPERHSIAEQIRQYSQASELVFMDGSALYLLWLCRLRTGVRIRVILRRRQGAWMCDQVKLLLPATAGLRWQVLNALKAESLTSENDWQSHNLADIAALANQLAASTFLPQEQIRQTLTTYTKELVANLDATQLHGVLQALLSQLLPPSEAPISGTRARLRRLAGRLKRRLTSP